MLYPTTLALLLLFTLTGSLSETTDSCLSLSGSCFPCLQQEGCTLLYDLETTRYSCRDSDGEGLIEMLGQQDRVKVITDSGLCR